jgi:biotin carboxyl carrier protein
MKKLRITIGKKTYDVTVEVLDEGTPAEARPISQPASPSGAASSTSAPAPSGGQPARPAPAAEAGAVISPMAGVVKSVLVKEGDDVEQGQTLLVLEAMKMDNRVNAPRAGSVAQVNVGEGQSVGEGESLVVLE